MKKNIILTTTHIIPNYEVVESRGLVFANVVLGANFFSDFAASLTDTFGGTSGTYQSKLSTIYDQVIKKIESEASQKKCNAIIGLKIDFDELSGKQKSMFMVNATGTACIARPVEQIHYNSDSNGMDANELDNAVKKFKILNKIKDRKSPKLSNEVIDYLSENPTKEVIDDLLDYYYLVIISATDPTTNITTSKRCDKNVDFIENYIGLIKDDDVIEKIYSKYLENDDFLPIIEKNNLFGSKQALALLDANPRKAVKILYTSPVSYTIEDLNVLKTIVEKVENLPITGRIEATKGGMFSKSQNLFICECGKRNDEGTVYCKQCGKNIKGLTREDEDVINESKIKIDILDKYFSH